MAFKLVYEFFEVSFLGVVVVFAFLLSLSSFLLALVISAAYGWSWLAVFFGTLVVCGMGLVKTCFRVFFVGGC